MDAEEEIKGISGEKTEDGNADAEDTELYEELGGIWKMEELEAIGRKREEADFLQLAFWVEYDAAAKNMWIRAVMWTLPPGRSFKQQLPSVKGLKIHKRRRFRFSRYPYGIGGCISGTWKSAHPLEWCGNKTDRSAGL